MFAASWEKRDLDTLHLLPSDAENITFFPHPLYRVHVIVNLHAWKQITLARNHPSDFGFRA